MQTVTTIGLDIAKSVFQVHGVNAKIPGVGPALATALVASGADPKAFRSGRDFSAWIGLVPKQNSSGGKDKLGSISKQGDRYLRSLFTAGALAVIRYAKIHGTKHRPCLSCSGSSFSPANCRFSSRMIWFMRPP
jgi:Transposase IS116/IS110/IS902 family